MSLKNYRYLLILLPVLSSFPAWAHLGMPFDRHTQFNPWRIDPIAVLLLLFTGWVYWRGCQRFRTRAAMFRQRQYYFWIGWGALAIALASPLDSMGEYLFSAHMVQHELMMLVAAPLLVISQPVSALLRGMATPFGRAFGRLARNNSARHIWDWITSPAVAWFIHAIGLWGWHLPSLFNAGLQNSWVHSLQHITFLWVALIFWFALFRSRHESTSAGVLYLFTTAIHASLLGALMTFSPDIWYTPYMLTTSQWGLSALEDQQLGGLIMWMPAGIVFVAAGLASLARTMQNSDSKIFQPRTPGENR